MTTVEDITQEVEEDPLALAFVKCPLSGQDLEEVASIEEMMQTPRTKRKARVSRELPPGVKKNRKRLLHKKKER